MNKNSKIFLIANTSNFFSNFMLNHIKKLNKKYKLFIFCLTAIIASIAGALYYPQAGIINPAELAPIASIYLAVWVAIGGRGRIYGSVIGAAFVSLLSSYFTGGQAPDVPLGFATLRWTEWWLVLLGFSFVAVTLYAPKGIGGLIDKISTKGET